MGFGKKTSGAAITKIHSPARQTVSQERADMTLTAAGSRIGALLQVRMSAQMMTMLSGPTCFRPTVPSGRTTLIL
eukprot:UN26391